MSKRYVDKEIEGAQAWFSWDVQKVVDGGTQGSYYIYDDDFKKLKEDGILIEEEIEFYPTDHDRPNDVKYGLNDYEFILGPEILEIIGEEYKEGNKFFIACTTGDNPKNQLMKTTYEHLTKHDSGYEWFVKLYDKNISKTNLIIDVCEEGDKKIFKLDIEYPSIKELISFKPVSPDKINHPHNRIVFGAPGTGKSNRLDRDRKNDFGENYERVTFYPNYSYSQFVGTYKPVQKIVNGEKQDDIIYDYVPGPFLRTYIKAMNNPDEPYLLLIEELNRANVASVFGDVFQLLDRKNGVSEYEIETTEDMRCFLKGKIERDDFNPKRIKLPSNMYIWATMNSADQGVFPVDAAFKRRWEFEYIGIDDNEEGIINIYVTLGEKDDKHEVNWNDLRKAINNKLSALNINEDKLLGPYFLSKEVLGIENDENVPYIKNKNKFFINDSKKFIDAFQSKVIMYLYEDVVKQKPGDLFEDCDTSRYSAVCDEFVKRGKKIFGDL